MQFKINILGILNMIDYFLYQKNERGKINKKL